MTNYIIVCLKVCVTGIENYQSPYFLHKEFPSQGVETGTKISKRDINSIMEYIKKKSNPNLYFFNFT